MESEAQAARLLVSRDSREEKDAYGDDVHWRETIDFRAALEEMEKDDRQKAIEAALGRMTGLSRQIARAYYRGGLGQRTIAAQLGLALSSFQHGPWAKMKADFKAAFGSI